MSVSAPYFRSQASIAGKPGSATQTKTLMTLTQVWTTPVLGLLKAGHIKWTRICMSGLHKHRVIVSYFTYVHAANIFLKLSKIYTILTDPAAKVTTTEITAASTKRCRYATISSMVLFPGSLRQVAEGQTRCQDEREGAGLKEEETEEG